MKNSRIVQIKISNNLSEQLKALEMGLGPDEVIASTSNADGVLVVTINRIGSSDSKLREDPDRPSKLLLG
jgi:hypothetical protein